MDEEESREWIGNMLLETIDIDLDLLKDHWRSLGTNSIRDEDQKST